MINGLSCMSCHSEGMRLATDEVAGVVADNTEFDALVQELGRSISQRLAELDDEGHGEVFAEQRNPGLEPYLGNRYPASDIPQIARRLYERNRIRVLVDINYTPVPIEPRQSPLSQKLLSWLAQARHRLVVHQDLSKVATPRHSLSSHQLLSRVVMARQVLVVHQVRSPEAMPRQSPADRRLKNWASQTSGSAEAWAASAATTAAASAEAPRLARPER